MGLQLKMGLKFTVHFLRVGLEHVFLTQGSLPPARFTAATYSPTVFSSTWPGRERVAFPASVSLQFGFEAIIFVPWTGSRGAALERKLRV